MIIDFYGKGERERMCAELLEKSKLGSEFSRLALLPIPTSRDKVHISGTDIPLSEFIRNTSPDTFVAGYGIPDGARELLLSRGISYFDAAEDEEFILENAYLTALGALSYLLKSEKSEPRDWNIGIIGFGRIGSALLRLLLFLGTSVTVYTGNAKTALSLGELGIRTKKLCEAEIGNAAADGVKIIFNTAPCELSGAFPEGILPPGQRVIELASGNNFDGVLGVEYLPGVPERAFPHSAARAYFRSIKGALGRPWAED